MTTLLASKDKVKILLSMIDKMPTLKHLILMDALDDELAQKAKELKIKILSITDVEALGAAKPLDPRPPTKDDVATICYTSGLL